MLHGLDPLGNHRETQLVTEADNRTDDRCRDPFAIGIDDDRLVDLDGVDRQIHQMGQRRVAGAEVVQRDPYPRP